MKGKFLALAMAAFASAFFSSSASAQLINELSVNPAGTDNPCEYIELIGTPGATIENVHFLSLEGDTNKGLVTAVVTFGVPGPVFGSNGLIVIVSPTQCGTRTYPAGTTVLTAAFLDTAGGALQNGSNSFLLVRSVTPIAPNTDLDTDDNGTLDAMPSGAVILDSVAWSDGGTTDVLYGTVLTASGGTIGAATRFPGNTTANSANAFYAGALVGTNDATTYSTTVRTANFPPDGVLTPGALNIGVPVPDSVADMNGDGKTDYVVLRVSGSDVTWFTYLNGIGPAPTQTWGTTADFFVPGDFDGDRKDDIAVWRPGATGTYFILNSSNSTIRVESFGQTGDDPTVFADYNGDNVDDLAIYREGATAGAQSSWHIKTSAGYYAVNWGQNGDTPSPGDYDGDNKADYVVRRPSGTEGHFYKFQTTAGMTLEAFGGPTDPIVPGDYDGDGKSDLATLRASGTSIEWRFEPSGTAGSTVVADTWGSTTGDAPVQGDYDADGKTDYAIWRQSTGTFHVMTVGTRRITSLTWGLPSDFPLVFLYNTH